jgi:hypothetical protein
MTPEEFYDIAHSAPRERAIRYLTEALKNHTLIAIYEARKAEQPAPTETASQGTFAVGLAAIDTLAERTGRLMRGATETAPKRDCPGSPCWHCGSTEHDTAAHVETSPQVWKGERLPRCHECMFAAGMHCDTCSNKTAPEGAPAKREIGFGPFDGTSGW